MPLAQYRMTQQQQQMMMYQQAQQQSIANSQWMGMHSASPFTTPSQNAWAPFNVGNQSNFNAQYAARSQQPNQLYTATLRGYPSIPQRGSATPVTTTSTARYDPDPRSTKSVAPMGSPVQQYNTNHALPQQHHSKRNAPTSEVDDVLSNEDAAAILALVEKESEQSASAAIGKS
ncbi:hypothetical protein AAVH_25772 [Aphelenchoides avenae]|nr:hypothetical protein AAVH_25772 [Aphelenchus avenae]